jgi:hypothetical protein
MSSSEERLKRLQDRTLSGTTVRYVRYGMDSAGDKVQLLVWVWVWVLKRCFVVESRGVVGDMVEMS